MFTLLKTYVLILYIIIQIHCCGKRIKSLDKPVDATAKHKAMIEEFSDL